jgi:hypothetical protein
MKEIKLTQGKVAIVDDEDYSLISNHKWHAFYYKKDNLWYASRIIRIANYHKRVWMHREIMGFITGDGNIVDHRNGNTLDNRRINLRKASFSQNSQNRITPHKHNLSGYYGVYWDKAKNKWRAAVCINYKSYMVRYNNKKTAAIFRDKLALHLHQDFAVLNFPELFFNGAL